NKAGTLLPTTVAEGITVNVLPNEAHEFLMTSKEVANGYGVSEYAIRQNKVSLGEDLKEGKHYVKGVSISHTLANAQPHQIFWTKRGIIRLGFAMRSERARLFRDWAEDFIVKGIEQGVAANYHPLPAKRKHNRLTPERLIGILSDVCKIEDSALRLSITNKLMQEGGVQ
ncbi:MAG: hypothetical protein ACRCZB_02830, partial [Bacteroidales bacterium]